ncbi:MAG: cytochrome c [Gammaproteobacteria bacterium]|jgi:cytochrome c|nr:cytochrome c [Gammaproteobacteria bacterium]MBT3860634.1 cytochrome c [Gammaproteobacteria bacterium]MBT3988771.1 cytochrome c [Gammaproteobacteria bacterium]MBT4582634.1 cytochrome c [Gammaproteobacteria bacterium]MBT4659294.1 cytochrome c [Gammaproteobacteria bacterium]
MPKLVIIILILLSPLGFASLAQSQNVGLGTPISQAQLSDFDLIAGPDGEGFPEGSGTAFQGKEVYDQKCQACHGANGEGTTANTQLVGGDMQSIESPVRTVGSYWPHASTIFDFIRRAMPADSPKSLSNIEVYQVTAYVLYMNGIIDQNKILDRQSLIDIKMPNKDGFVDMSQQQ